MQPIVNLTQLRNRYLFLLTACLIMFVPLAWSTGEYCDEWEREDKAKAAKMKAELKASARREGVPERLLHLYDELPDCEMCLEDTSPVPFITIHYQPDGHPKKTAALHNTKAHTIPWSADIEYEARYGLREGYIQAFYIYVAASQCVCCTANNGEEYEDWNPYPDEEAPSPGWIEELDLDSSLSEAYTDPDDLGDYPPDLTEIDENEQYPDIIEPPPLVTPPPIRPMTTLCTQCQPQVSAYNEHVKVIRAKQIAIAKLKQQRGVTHKAISYRLRAIRAHKRKAQVGDWEDVLDAMNDHRADLYETERRDTARIQAEQRELAQLMEQLTPLRDAVHQCEESCRLQDSQLPPTAVPEPIVYGEDAPLPPYVRIASQPCYACRGAMEARNELARQMNAEVTAMILSGYSEERLARWNALREQLKTASEALSDCLARCDEPETDKPADPAPATDPPKRPAGPAADPDDEPGVSDDAPRPEPRTHEEIEADWRAEFNRCEPCNEYWHKYRALLEQINPLVLQLRSLLSEDSAQRDKIRLYSDKVKKLEGLTKLDLPAKDKAKVYRNLRIARRLLRDAQQRLNTVTAEIQRVKEALRELETRALVVKAQWRHCVATRCRLKTALPLETPPDQLGYPEGFERDDLTMMMFVATSCVPCEADARVINDWLLEQYESWLAGYMVTYRGIPWNFLTEDNRRGEQWPEFWHEFQLRLLGLRECEKQCKPAEDPVPATANDADEQPHRQDDSMSGISVVVADVFGIEGLRVIPAPGVVIQVLDPHNREVTSVTTGNTMEAYFLKLKPGTYSLQLDIGDYKPALPAHCTNGYRQLFEVGEGEHIQFAASVYSATVAADGRSVGTVTGDCIRRQ